MHGHWPVTGKFAVDFDPHQKSKIIHENRN